MKKGIFFFVVILSVAAISCKKTPDKELIQFTNTLIGTSYKLDSPEDQDIAAEDYGHVLPSVGMPFGMTQWTPQNVTKEKTGIAPYYSNLPNIQGFRATHWPSGTNGQDYGSFTFMPLNDYFRTMPEQRQSMYDLRTVVSTPAYFSVLLSETGIMVEITATKRAGFFRFSWAAPNNPFILVDINSDMGQGYIKIDTARNEIYGYNPVNRICNGESQTAGFNGYFVARFNTPITEFGTYAGMEYFPKKGEDSAKPNLGGYAGFDLSGKNYVLMKVGTSFTSIENARKNLDSEIPHWDFAKTENEARDIWNKLYGTITVEGGTDEDIQKFYTAIYHSCMLPRLFSDADGSYPGFNGTGISKAEGFEYYCDFSAWDTYRAQMPLVSLLSPSQYADMIKSLEVKAGQGGWLPISTNANCYNSAKIGDPVSAIIGDAYLKGFDVDIEKLWPYMLKNAFETPENPEDYKTDKGRRGLKSYIEYGYVMLEDSINEAIHKGGQVTATLEYAYSDWVLAQVAKKLGKVDINKSLLIRAENYANVFDPDKGWVCGRWADGSFTSDFWESGTMPYLAEGSPKQNSFFAPHNVAGLIETMGGTNVFREKLDGLFSLNQYHHGKSSAHHIPYLYNYLGDWQKTQEVVKNILKSDYRIANISGLAGNDNSGQLSAWYVFSAMGFYPVCLGSDEYQLSSPIFGKVSLNLDKNYYSGKKFTISGSVGNPYQSYKSASLNGKKTGTVLKQSQLAKGGKLVFSAE